MSSSSKFINRYKGRHVPHNKVEIGKTYVVEHNRYGPRNRNTPERFIQELQRIYYNNQGGITSFRTDKINTLLPENTKFYNELPKALRRKYRNITYPKGMSPKVAYVQQQGLKRSKTVRNKLNQLRKKNNATRRKQMMNLAQQLQEMQLGNNNHGNNNHGNNQNNNNRNNNI